MIRSRYFRVRMQTQLQSRLAALEFNLIFEKTILRVYRTLPVRGGLGENRGYNEEKKAIFRCILFLKVINYNCIFLYKIYLNVSNTVNNFVFADQSLFDLNVSNKNKYWIINLYISQAMFWKKLLFSNISFQNKPKN